MACLSMEEGSVFGDSLLITPIPSLYAERRKRIQTCSELSFFSCKRMDGGPFAESNQVDSEEKEAKALNGFRCEGSLGSLTGSFLQERPSAVFGFLGAECNDEERGEFH